MNASDKRLTLWGLMYGVAAQAIFIAAQNLVGQQAPNLDDTERVIVAAIIPIVILFYLLRREEKVGGTGH